MRTLLLLSVFAPEDIGARIAQARREAGLTQEELADLVGVSTRSFQGYESGAVVPYRHLGKISEILQRTVPWFLHGEESAEAAPVQPNGDTPATFGLWQKLLPLILLDDHAMTPEVRQIVEAAVDEVERSAAASIQLAEAIRARLAREQNG